MKTYKEFLYEMPLRLDNRPDKDDGVEKNTIGNYYKSRKSLFKSHGDYNSEYEHKSLPEDKKIGRPEVHVLVHKKTGVPHLHVELTSTRRSMQSQTLRSHVDNTARAHDFYAHLVNHHGITLRSDEAQTDGGAKVWEKLHRSGNVTVRHVDENDKDLPIHTDDWYKNYNKVKTLDPNHKNKATTRSTFIATRK